MCFAADATNVCLRICLCLALSREDTLKQPLKIDRWTVRTRGRIRWFHDRLLCECISSVAHLLLAMCWFHFSMGLTSGVSLLNHITAISRSPVLYQATNLCQQLTRSCANATYFSLRRRWRNEFAFLIEQWSVTRVVTWLRNANATSRELWWAGTHRDLRNARLTTFRLVLCTSQLRAINRIGNDRTVFCAQNRWSAQNFVVTVQA